MTFTTAIKTCLSKYASFHGRASRPEYWWFVLFVVVAQIVAGLMDRTLFPVEMIPVEGSDLMVPDQWIQPFEAIASLALFLPMLAVGARRLHDMGRSGWWLLLPLIPILGALVLLYFLIQPSKENGNSYA